MLCPRCNMEVNDGSVVCTNCGNVMQNPNDNKNYVGMNRVVLSEQPAAMPQQTSTPVEQPTVGTPVVEAQPVQQAINPVEKQPVTAVPEQPIVSEQPVAPVVGAQPVQPVVQTTIDNQVNVQQAIQPNNTQAPPQNNVQQSGADNTNKALFIISGIITVIASLICLYFLYSILKGLPNIIKLGMKYKLHSYILRSVTIDALVIGIVLILSYTSVKNSETGYLSGLKTGAVVITIVMTLLMIIFAGIKSLFSFTFIEILITSILLFYSAYFITKIANSFINSKLPVYNPIQQLIISCGISISIYYVAYIIFMEILQYIVLRAWAEALSKLK